jgi:pimeloyl-ACP methyl ester carboxylesterase
MTVRQLSLSDGRSLDVYVTGDDNATPFVFLHGTPGAAVTARALERGVHERGLRFVGPARPGYGRSTRLPGRAVAAVVADVEAVLDSLGATSCFVAGWSGGGPHALACAARLKAATSVLVISGIAPYDAADLDFLAGMGQDNIDELGAALAGEQAIRAFLDALRPELLETTAESVTAAFGNLLPDVDRAVLTDEFAEDVAAQFRNAVSVSVDGWVDDDLAFVKPWGFDLADIRVPTSLWQGSEDLMVPFTHGQWFAQRLPQAQVHLEQGEGHLSIGLGALDQMLDELVTAT